MNSLGTFVPLRSDVLPRCLVRTRPCVDVLEKSGVHLSVVSFLELASNVLPFLPFFDMEANLEWNCDLSKSVNIRARRKVHIPQ